MHQRAPCINAQMEREWHLHIERIHALGLITPLPLFRQLFQGLISVCRGIEARLHVPGSDAALSSDLSSPPYTPAPPRTTPPAPPVQRLVSTVKGGFRVQQSSEVQVPAGVAVQRRQSTNRDECSVQQSSDVQVLAGVAVQRRR